MNLNQLTGCQFFQVEVTRSVDNLKAEIKSLYESAAPMRWLRIAKTATESLKQSVRESLLNGTQWICTEILRGTSIEKPIVETLAHIHKSRHESPDR